MPKKYYTIKLSDESEIVVYFETVNGLIINYVVKLVQLIDKKYCEIVRFDNAHGCPHKDIIDKKGNIIRKIWFESIDNKQGLDMAIKDLKDNYEMYIERYKRWLKS